MSKENSTSKCPVCGINQYPQNNGPDMPSVWPCGVGLFREENLKPADKKVCPYETPAEQKDFMLVGEWEKVAGLLNTVHGDG